MIVRDAASVPALDPAVTGLQIFGSDVRDLEPVAELRGLTHLAIVACPVRDLAPLADLENLEELEVSFTFAEDVGPLFAIPTLRRVRLLGNPWTRASYLAAHRRLIAAGGDTRACLTNPVEWALGRALHERGLPLCYGSGLLVRPGRGWSSRLVPPERVGEEIRRGRA